MVDVQGVDLVKFFAHDEKYLDEFRIPVAKYHTHGFDQFCEFGNVVPPRHVYHLEEQN
jgi:hypothetical protein